MINVFVSWNLIAIFYVARNKYKIFLQYKLFDVFLYIQNYFLSPDFWVVYDTLILIIHNKTDEKL